MLMQMFHWLFAAWRCMHLPSDVSFSHSFLLYCESLHRKCEGHPCRQRLYQIDVSLELSALLQESPRKAGTSPVQAETLPKANSLSSLAPKAKVKETKGQKAKAAAAAKPQKVGVLD